MLSSLVIETRFAEPSISKETVSNSIPKSSEIIVPFVRIAMSSSIAFLRSPKPGALTAETFKPPLSLFTTNVASASPSTSSAIIKRGRPDLAVASKIGNIGCKLVSFFS